MGNWSADDLRGLGFDPATGARMDGYPLGEQSPAGTKSSISSISSKRGKSKPVAHPLSAAARSYLKPEALLQVEVIETFRPRLVAGAKLISLGQELPGGSKLFRLWQSIRAAMGYEAGTPDLCALNGGRFYLIELKRDRGEPDLLGHRKARGELSDGQREFRAWCKLHGWPLEVCRTLPQVENALMGWRLLR